jgi:SpoVK/Ycf46/Vps4 family AAA+-type ATPase
VFLGETPHRVERVFDDADGGILFIDEAYSLTSGDEDMYGAEAIESIVKLMEDRRDRVVVIAAGYPSEMRQFVNSNPGLRSRFNRSIYFADYSTEQLQEILKQTCRSKGFEATDGFFLRSELLWERLERYGLTSESNARLVRNAFDLILEKQAERLTAPNRKTLENNELCQLLPQDLDGIEERLREIIDD